MNYVHLVRPTIHSGLITVRTSMTITWHNLLAGKKQNKILVQLTDLSNSTDIMKNYLIRKMSHAKHNGPQG